jgi:hypothetical protein
VASYQSVNVVIGNPIAGALLGALSVRPAGALWSTPKVRLFNSPTVNPQPTTPLATYTAAETAFSGYTSGGIAPTFSGVVNLTPGSQGIVANVTYVATTATPFVPDTIYGWWADDGTNPVVAEKFAGGRAIPISNVGDWLELQIAFPVNSVQATQ